MADRRRVFRVAEKIRTVVAMELHRVADPRLALVTISSVVVSPDLRSVKIYWMVSGDAERRAEVAEAFEGAVGMFRRLLGKELAIRFVPEIRFYYDDTLDTSEEVDRLLRRVREQESAATSQDSLDEKS